jgi:hypothetical protein
MNQLKTITDFLCKLTAEKTDGVMTQWPWTDTDEKLAAIKYRVVLLPGAKTQEHWIKSASRNLHAKPQATLLKDLDNNLIDVVYDTTIPDKVNEKKNKRGQPGPKNAGQTKKPKACHTKKTRAVRNLADPCSPPASSDTESTPPSSPSSSESSVLHSPSSNQISE